MCTAATYQNGDHYFGRTLDYTFSYGENVVVTPRNHPFHFRCMDTMNRHLAMIGMAHMAKDDPLYYEATNEAGLSMAGLNFPELTKYQQEEAGKDNLAPFELIPWILGQCRSVKETRELLARLQLVDLSYGSELPVTPLHWIIADRSGALTLECTKDGLQIYENPVGILTNCPSFDYQMTNLSNFMRLSSRLPENCLAPEISLHRYSLGMGALGLPGDFSSVSRFVRCAFMKLNAHSDKTEEENMSQFFHMMETVCIPRGAVEGADGRDQITVYTSCCNTDQGIYYYTTQENRQISAVHMHRTDLEAKHPHVFSPVIKQQIYCHN